MAEVHEAHSTSEQGSTELNRLKKDLEGYREIILPLNKVLEWEQNHYPAILVTVITLVFAIIWYLEPSVLTSFSLFGVILCLIDFVVPTISCYLFASAEWTVVQERQFEAICTRLLNAKDHIKNVKKALVTLKNEKPKAYLLVMMGAFAILAWVGSLIDNLLLTYLLIVFLMLVPGLRKHGILQQATNTIMTTFKKVINKNKAATTKSKTN